jgi:hypothetical protein
MSITSLVAEFLVIGLIPFLTIVLVALSILGIYDLSFLSQTKDLSALLVAAAMLAVYLLGALTHRLGQLLNRNSMSFLFHRFIESRAYSYEEWLADYVLVLQYGSEQLTERIHFGESLSRIFKSTAITAPLLAIALALWLSVAAGWKSVVIAVVICALITIASFVSFLLQRRNHQQMVRTASKLIKTVTRPNKRF